MKFVIDIPKEVYKCVMDGTYCGTLYEELKNGVPVEPERKGGEMMYTITKAYESLTQALLMVEFHNHDINCGNRYVIEYNEETKLWELTYYSTKEE